MNDKDPRWQRLAALLVIIGLAAAAYVFRDRLSADFLPLDSSRIGPNLLASLIQAALVTVVLALLYPPFRRAVHRFVDRKTDAVHARLDELHERHDAHGEHLDRLGRSLIELHEKLDAQAPKPARKPVVRKAAAKPTARSRKA